MQEGLCANGSPLKLGEMSTRRVGATEGSCALSNFLTVFPLHLYMRKLILLLGAVILTLAADAQRGRQLRPLYQLGGKWSPNGWHFGIGATQMLPNDFQRDDTRMFATEQGAEVLYSGNFTASGRTGLYLEVGRQHFFEDPIFVHYIDFGAHFKMLRGEEGYQGVVLNEASGALAPTDNTGTFSDSYAGLYFNANHIHQITDASFLQYTIGANAGYRVIERRTFEGIALPDQEFADPLQVQLHAKLGYGFRLESGVFLIPAIETPILNLSPFYDGKSTLPMFNTRYRPIIFSLRILLFSHQKVGDCVGKGTEKRGHHLWGKDMRR